MLMFEFESRTGSELSGFSQWHFSCCSTSWASVGSLVSPAVSVNGFSK